MLGCTIPDRAPHLVPSIQEFLRRLGRPADLGEVGCCGSLEVEVGRAMPSVRVKAGVVADPICFEQYGAELLGVLAMQHLFDLKPPFYYYAPHRIVNGDHARVYPLYDALRRCFGCDMNIDLNRLARSTSAGSIQGLSGNDARDISAAVARLSEIVLPLRPNGALERAFPHQSSSGHDPTGGSNDATDAEADLWRSAGDSHGAAGVGVRRLAAPQLQRLLGPHVHALFRRHVQYIVLLGHEYRGYARMCRIREGVRIVGRRTGRELHGQRHLLRILQGGHDVLHRSFNWIRKP